MCAGMPKREHKVRPINSQSDNFAVPCSLPRLYHNVLSGPIHGLEQGRVLSSIYAAEPISTPNAATQDLVSIRGSGMAEDACRSENGMTNSLVSGECTFAASILSEV